MQGEAQFLTAEGQLVTTRHAWRTHIARLDELVLARLAFCRADYHAKESKPPKDKRDSKLAYWLAGRISDVADIAKGIVRVADCDCTVAAVRVSDTP